MNNLICEVWCAGLGQSCGKTVLCAFTVDVWGDSRSRCEVNRRLLPSRVQTDPLYASEVMVLQKETKWNCLGIIQITFLCHTWTTRLDCNVVSLFVVSVVIKCSAYEHNKTFCLKRYMNGVKDTGHVTAVSRAKPLFLTEASSFTQHEKNSLYWIHSLRYLEKGVLGSPSFTVSGFRLAGKAAVWLDSKRPLTLAVGCHLNLGPLSGTGNARCFLFHPMPSIWRLIFVTDTNTQ